MPILTEIPVKHFDQESFHHINKIVTGFAFDIHNQFGRYLHESLYQSALTSRCERAGLHVKAEMRIEVRYESFCKEYFVDHVVERGVILETKAVSALTDAHRGQAMNYLFLCGQQHGSLINFRSERVEHEFVSTTLTQEERRRFTIHLEHWEPLTENCHRLLFLLREFLQEWGAFLDPRLYRDAITAFFGGEEKVLLPVEVIAFGTSLGLQQTHLISPEIAFSVTAATRFPDAECEHQQRFLKHSKLRAIQWINLNHHQIELRTIRPR